MDSILNALGVRVASEATVERTVLAEKILTRIQYHGNNMTLVPSLKRDALPKLSAETLLSLTERLRKEIETAEASGDDVLTVKAKMKYKFLVSMLKGDDDKIAVAKLQYQRKLPPAKLITTDQVSALPASSRDLARDSARYGASIARGAGAPSAVLIPRLADRDLSLVDGDLLESLRKEAASARRAKQ